MKQQRAANGKAKAPLREIKLAKKRSGRDKKAAELARLTAVVRVTTYSEQKPMNNQDLADQLKHLKLVLGRDIKKTSLPNRKAYVIRLIHRVWRGRQQSRGWRRRLRGRRRAQVQGYQEQGHGQVDQVPRVRVVREQGV